MMRICLLYPIVPMMLSRALVMSTEGRGECYTSDLGISMLSEA